MARKKNGNGTTETPAAAKTEAAAATLQMTPENTLKSLLSRGKKAKQEMSEIAGDFGQAVQNAVESKHLHRKAFSITRQLHNMTDEKLAETMAHLDYYLDACGIRSRVEKVGRLDLGDGQPGETEDRPGLKVHEGGRGRDVGETAGAAAGA